MTATTQGDGPIFPSLRGKGGEPPASRERTFGRPRRHFAQCASTNDIARAWACNPDAPAPHGALVTADFQTRGRGQRGRRWEAPTGQSALMSFVLRPDHPIAQAGQIGFVAALAVADTLAQFGLEPRLKWPNDVLLNDAKIAGVLVETVLTPPSFPPVLGAGRPAGAWPPWAAIVGIGINVNQEQFAGADDFVSAPTSLRRATGSPHSVEQVIQGVARMLAGWEFRHWDAGFDPILRACRERLAVGAAVRRGTIRATLDGLNEDGGARVILADGTFADWTSVEGEGSANGV